MLFASKNSPIYSSDPRTRYAAVNAGDTRLYVGGYGINGAFAKILPHDELYTTLHSAALDIAKQAKPGTTIHVPHPHTIVPSVEKCYARLGCDTVACVIISVLKPEFRPLNNSNNLAMVYTVGPRGSDVPNQTKFLQLCRAVGENIRECVFDYNKENPNQSIQTLRMCLVSGGAYKHKDVTKKEVAKQLMDGLGSIDGVTIEYAYDENVFQDVQREVRN